MGLIQTWCLATEKLLNNLSDFSFIDRWVNLWVLSLFLLYGRRVRGIDLILKVFLPPPDNTPRLSQQLPTCSVNCTGNALLPPSEVLNGSSKVLCGQMRVHIYGLNSSQTKIFAPETAHRCSTLGMPVLISSLKSHTNQPGSIGFLLRPDGIRLALGWHTPRAPQFFSICSCVLHLRDTTKVCHSTTLMILAQVIIPFTCGMFHSNTMIVTAAVFQAPNAWNMPDNMCMWASADRILIISETESPFVGAWWWLILLANVMIIF